MDPQDRRILLQTLELAQENNRILRQMRRLSRWGTFVRIVYWFVLIGISFGAYYFLQPYIDGAKATYTSIQSDVGNLKTLRDALLMKKK